MWSLLPVVIPILAPCVNAFPAVAGLPTVASNVNRAAAPKVAENEPNSGFFPNTEFNAQDQYVDVSPGSGHEFMAPGPNDLRGPCPGLNAAANHGFVSRSGLLDLDDTVNGLSEAYSFGADFSAPLFVFATFNSGDFVTMKWSIGGPMAATIIGQGRGISNSHNKYEADASPGRFDAYLNNGNAHSLSIKNFENLYNLANEDGEYTMDILRTHNINTYEYSINNNPYFFSGPVFFVPPIAHQFIVAFMSNNSAERMQGFLTKDVLKSFFSVTEASDGTLTWVPGHERIPDNWYKRPSSNPYGIAASFGDFGYQLINYPNLLRFGGNMGKTNSFVGIDATDLTGGVYNSATLLEGNNLACFAFEATSAGMSEEIAAIGSLVQPFLTVVDNIMGPLYEKLSCPQLAQYNPSLFDQFPGYTYQEPLQPDTPY